MLRGAPQGHERLVKLYLQESLTKEILPQPHKLGVNALAFHPGQDKPLSLSGDESLKTPTQQTLLGDVWWAFSLKPFTKRLERKRKDSPKPSPEPSSAHSATVSSICF